MLENVSSNNQKYDKSWFHKERSILKNVSEETDGTDDLIENPPSDIENDAEKSKSTVIEKE